MAGTLSTLTARSVRCGVKNGLTLAGFAEKYQCSEVDIQRRIRSIFRHDADRVLDEVEANAKKPSRRRSHSNNLLPPPRTPLSPAAQSGSSAITGIRISPAAAAILGIDPESIADPGTTPSSIEPKDTMPDSAKSGLPEPPAIKPRPKEDRIPEKPIPEPLMLSETSLNELRDQARVQSDSIIALEIQYKELFSQHRECIKQLRAIESGLKDLERQLQENITNYQQIIDNDNQLIAQMNAISQNRRIKVAALEDLRQEIQRLEIVAVCAYANGAIEPLEAVKIALDDTGSEQLYDLLISDEAYQDLRVRDIRLLARMVCIVKNSPFQISPIFENEYLDEYYQRLRTA